MRCTGLFLCNDFSVEINLAEHHKIVYSIDGDSFSIDQVKKHRRRFGRPWTSSNFQTPPLAFWHSVAVVRAVICCKWSQYLLVETLEEVTFSKISACSQSKCVLNWFYSIRRYDSIARKEEIYSGPNGKWGCNVSETSFHFILFISG